MDNIAKMAETTPIKPPKLDHIDQAILQAATVSPNLPINAIANNLIRTGIVNSRDTVYKRLRNKDYLRGEFEKIQQNHREQFSRELMPLAIKKTRKALKTLDEKEAYPYVAMTVKTTLGDQGPAAPQTTINIGQMQVLQGIMRGNSDKVGISEGEDK